MSNEKGKDFEVNLSDEIKISEKANIANKQTDEQKSETVAKAMVLFYLDVKRTLTQMRDLFLRIGALHIVNVLNAAIEALAIDLKEYEKQQEAKK